MKAESFEAFQAKVAARIRRLRISKGLTQEDMDEGEWAVPVRTIQAIEGAKSDLKLSSLYKIARRLKVAPGQLLKV